MRRWLNLTRCLSVLVVLLGASSSFGTVILNEYNAVRDSRWLDADGAAASTATDTYFGRIEGNGGRWMELLVVGSTSAAGETIDMRDWSFDWTSTDVGSGSFALSNNASLADIHRGMVVTFFSQDAGGPNVGSNLTGVGTSTAAGGNLSQYDPDTGNWWLNINIADNALVSSGSLNTGNGDWQVTVRDNANDIVFGPAGEGVGTFSGVSSREVGKLEAFTGPNTIADWQGITPLSTAYNDGTSSTFGSGNLWSSGSNVQDFSPLQVVPEPSTWVMGLVGIACGGWQMWRRRRARS
jgi:hypothetical protein